MPRAEPILQGVARAIAHGGEAAVESELGVVLVRGALPGETLRMRVGDKRGGVRRGKLLELIGQPSPDRRQPPCAITEQCGGCPLMIWAASAQQRHKLELVAQAVAGHGPAGGDPAVQWEPSPQDLGYRQRARLAWERHGVRASIGYRAGGSRRVQPIDDCPVLTESIAQVVPLIAQELGPSLSGSGEIELTPGAAGVCVSLSTDTAQPPAVYSACAALAGTAGVAGVALRAGGIAAAATWGVLEQRVAGGDGAPVIGPATGFSQANAAINRRLSELVVELAEPSGAHVLELYAGNGNLTVALARQAAQVSAVELDRELVDACRRNLGARGLTNVKVRADAAEAGARGAKVDCVVLDPPRTGAREAIDGIVARKPARIVYVSCDPITLRRDAQAFAQAGYRVDRAHALDMFPHTAHVESVVRFVRV